MLVLRKLNTLTDNQSTGASGDAAAQAKSLRTQWLVSRISALENQVIQATHEVEMAIQYRKEVMMELEEFKLALDAEMGGT